MTTIKATCPTCGEVGLTAEEVELWIDGAERDASFYAFSCPACLQVVRKPADARVIRLLSGGGVQTRELAPTLQPRFSAPVLTPDDLLDFHELLATDGWFDDVVALVRG
jgi:hypothetical protein